MRKKILLIVPMLLTFLVFSCDTEPLEGEFSSTPDGSDPEEFCQNAALVISDAQIAFLNASETNVDALCENLRNTIENVINVCGDTDGVFQALLDELGNDCMIDTDGNDDDDDDAGVDPIIGEWGFVRAVDFFNDMEIEFLADDCSSQSREIFQSDGTYSFTQFSDPDNECVNGFFSTSGSWVNENGIYQIEFEFVCIGGDCDDETPPNITLVDDNTLRIQFDGQIIDGELVEFFFREYTRL